MDTGPQGLNDTLNIAPRTTLVRERHPSKDSCQRLQGCLTSKKTPPPRTLPRAYAEGPRGILGGWPFSHGRGTPVALRKAAVEKNFPRTFQSSDPEVKKQNILLKARLLFSNGLPCLGRVCARRVRVQKSISRFSRAYKGFKDDPRRDDDLL